MRGAGRGHRLGFATANLDVGHPDKLIPHEGIYAVRAALRDRTVDGVLHLGPRPTFAGLPPSIELHLFDFDGDLYGTRVTVMFHGRVRDIARFDSVEALVRAMEQDCQAARRMLASG
jgi:riboflavin kinase / FMN adenylyltransferase